MQKEVPLSRLSRVIVSPDCLEDDNLLYKLRLHQRLSQNKSEVSQISTNCDCVSIDSV